MRQQLPFPRVLVDSCPAVTSPPFTAGSVLTSSVKNACTTSASCASGGAVPGRRRRAAGKSPGVRIRNVSLRAQVVLKRLRLLGMTRQPVVRTGCGHRPQTRCNRTRAAVPARAERCRRSPPPARGPAGFPPALKPGRRIHFSQELALARTGVARRAERDRPEPSNDERREPPAKHEAIIRDEPHALRRLEITSRTVRSSRGNALGKRSRT